MKKSTLSIIALFLVLFTAAGVFSASATSDGVATTTSDGYYCSTIPVGSSLYPSTTVPNSDYICSTTVVYPETTSDIIDLDVKTILQMIVELAKSETGQWSDIENAVVRIIDIIENMDNGAVTEDEIDDAVADLEAALADTDIEGMDELLAALKAKIKAMYAGEVATTAVTETTTYPIATGTDTDAPTFATGTDTDCDCNESLWDIIGGWFDKIADFFRNILEFIC